VNETHTPRWPRRWPVAVISLPAAVATWSGWVGLGEMTGFGKVKLLPGIWDSLQINTAVTLPVGVEAYAAYALSAALTSAPVTGPTRRFAWISSVCALALGMGAQIAYHLLRNSHRSAAPWQITTFVSCLAFRVRARRRLQKLQKGLFGVGEVAGVFEGFVCFAAAGYPPVVGAFGYPGCCAGCFYRRAVLDGEQEGFPHGVIEKFRGAPTARSIVGHVVNRTNTTGLTSRPAQFKGSVPQGRFMSSHLMRDSRSRRNGAGPRRARAGN
jgi:hypothetical protein